MSKMFEDTQKIYLKIENSAKIGERKDRVSSKLNVTAQNNVTMPTSLNNVRMLLDVLEKITFGVSTI